MWSLTFFLTRSRFFHLASLFVILLTTGMLVAAHPAPFSYLDVRLSQEEWHASLVVHVTDLAQEFRIENPATLYDPQVIESRKHEILQLILSRIHGIADGQRLQIEVSRVEPLPERHALGIFLQFKPAKRPGHLKIECYLFPSEPEHLTLTGIYDYGELVRQDVLDRDRRTIEYFTGGAQGAFAVVRRFTKSGFEHILAGPDHLLFIFGLLLLGGSLWRLLTIVTAFTIAHSVTLSLAALNVLSPPERLVESIIALSIVFVGIDNLVVGKSGRDVRVWVAFFFGLVHGFGFAGVLRESGLPANSMALSLFSFNLGVEIGQALIVVLLATVLSAVRRRSPQLSQRITLAGSIVVVLAGVYWFAERTFFA